MLSKAARTILRIIEIGVLTGMVVILLPRLITAITSFSRRYTTQTVAPAPVAVVFGAGLWRDGTPTTVLRDRIATAAELYFNGKVQKILMSGDNTDIYYNEPGAMHDYALSLGVPDEDIVLDYAGRRTYDTCYRAQAIFGIHTAILVTQSFHLPRALYTCRALGMDVVGVTSDRQDYRLSSQVWWNLRELPATLTALLQVHITHPLPILGNLEPIFPITTQ